MTKQLYGTLRDPATSASAVTASASKLSAIPRALYIATDGNLTVELMEDDGSPVTLSNVKAGTILAIRPLRVTAAPANTIALF